MLSYRSRGDLLYAEMSDMNEIGICIKRKTDEKTDTLPKTEKFEDVIAIHSFLINGHILVFIRIRGVTERFRTAVPYFNITKYDQNGVKIQGIDLDDWVQRRLGNNDTCITENRNGDIIIFGHEMKEVVGMDMSGGRRFKYLNAKGLIPNGICTDKYGHILVAFYDSIHLLN